MLNKIRIVNTSTFVPHGIQQPTHHLLLDITLALEVHLFIQGIASSFIKNLSTSERSKHLVLCKNPLKLFMYNSYS